MRLIDKEGLISIMNAKADMAWGTPKEIFFSVARMVNLLPDVDAEPVRHGKWVWDTEDFYFCTCCGEKSRVKEVMGKPDWGWCPNCGAKMDKEDE